MVLFAAQWAHNGRRQQNNGKATSLYIGYFCQGFNFLLPNSFWIQWSSQHSERTGINGAFWASVGVPEFSSSFIRLWTWFIHRWVFKKTWRNWSSKQRFTSNVKDCLAYFARNATVTNIHIKEERSKPETKVWWINANLSSIHDCLWLLCRLLCLIVVLLYWPPRFSIWLPWMTKVKVVLTSCCCRLGT
jgi:hypothetical protein